MLQQLLFVQGDIFLRCAITHTICSTGINILQLKPSIGFQWSILLVRQYPGPQILPGAQLVDALHVGSFQSS